MQIIVQPELVDMNAQTVRYMAYKTGIGSAMLVSFKLEGAKIVMVSEVWGVAPAETIDAEVLGE